MRETVRAIIINNKQQTFLVQHNERNPNDLGKWATVGGGIDPSDENHESCLLREISEEFGLDTVRDFKIIKKAHMSVLPHRVDHFYFAVFSGTEFIPQAKDEIINSGWFSLDEVRNMKFFFGFKPELIKEAIDKASVFE